MSPEGRVAFRFVSAEVVVAMFACACEEEEDLAQDVLVLPYVVGCWAVLFVFFTFWCSVLEKDVLD